MPNIYASGSYSFSWGGATKESWGVFESVSEDEKMERDEFKDETGKIIHLVLSGLVKEYQFSYAVISGGTRPEVGAILTPTDSEFDSAMIVTGRGKSWAKGARLMGTLAAVAYEDTLSTTSTTTTAA